MNDGMMEKWSYGMMAGNSWIWLEMARMAGNYGIGWNGFVSYTLSCLPDIAPPTAPVTAPPQACETVGLKVRQESGLIRFSNRNVGLSWVRNLVGLVSEAVLQ